MLMTAKDPSIICAKKPSVPTHRVSSKNYSKVIVDDNTSIDHAKKFAMELIEQTKSLGNIKCSESSTQIGAFHELEISVKNAENANKKDFSIQKGNSLIRHKQKLGLINIELSPKVNCGDPTMIFRNAQIRLYKNHAKSHTLHSNLHGSRTLHSSNNEFRAIHRQLIASIDDNGKNGVFC